MSKRRTAEEVFNLPDPVKRFVDHGMLTDAEPAATNSDIFPAKVVELSDGRSAWPKPPDADRLMRTETERQQQGRSVDITRTYAKATVQKTVRFQPRLIAELETYLRDRDSDEDRIPFQRIQNEALELWLENHVRKSNVPFQVKGH